MEKKEPLAAIIVPAYNQKESYLSECISSVLAQTVRNFRLILVDDGSEPKCASFLDETAAKDERIRLVRKQNGGFASARNAGLDEASDADYIAFLDSDDVLEPRFLERCLDEAESSGADMIACTHTRLMGDKKIPGGCIIPARKVFEGDKITDFLRLCLCSIGVEDLVFPYCPTVWGKLFRAELFAKKDGQRFDESLRFAEDQCLIQGMADKLDKVVVLGEDLYSYRVNDDSFVRRWKDDFIDSNLHAFDVLDKTINKDSALLREAFDNYRAGHLVVYGTSYLYHPAAGFSYQKRRQLLKAAAGLPHFAGSLRGIKSCYFRKFQYIYLMCLKLGFYDIALLAAFFGARHKWKGEGTAA